MFVIRKHINYYIVPSLQAQVLHPQAKLQWKKCADIPVEMSRPQVVVMREKVYIGGGRTKRVDNYTYLRPLKCVFQYDPSRDEWSRLPPCQVIGFAMAQFAGNLITVGGIATGVTGLLQGTITRLLQGDFMKGLVTGKMYCFNEQSKKWEEFLKPMPTARYRLSVATTQSAIVASGGSYSIRDLRDVPCATVEVYNSETSQWHTADPLPVPCAGITSVTIADIWYQLGGGSGDKNIVVRSHTDGKSLTTVLYAPLAALIQRATSPTHQSASHISVWKNLPDTPLVRSAAASLSGSLLAMGGSGDETFASPAVYVFLSLTNSWVRVTTGDLPEPRYACTTVQLSSNRLLVVGGFDDQGNYTKTVFLGSIHLEQ